MISKILRFPIFLIIICIFSACEVFRTSPSNSQRSQTSQRPAPNRNDERPTLIGNMKKKKEGGRTASDNRRTANTRTSNTRPSASRSSSNTSARTTGARPATTARSSTGTPARPLATKPAGSYEAAVPDLIRIARTYTGTPYRSGGNDKNGIDCSGLICQVYSEYGLKVPRISWQQSEFGREVESISDIQPGDWLFFVPEGGKEGYVSHSGIVTEVRGEKDIRFIHASSSRGVIEDNLFSNYFRNRFVKAIRPF